MFFSNRDRFEERRRRESVDGRETSLFIPVSCLASPRGGARMVERYVDVEEQLKRQLPRDERSYDVTGTLLDKSKGKTITPRRPELKLKDAIPGPATYCPPAPSLLKPSFNRSKFAPVLPDSPSHHRKEYAAPRFRGAYLNLSPSRDARSSRTIAGDDDEPRPHAHSPSHSPTVRSPTGQPSPPKGKHSPSSPSRRHAQLAASSPGSNESAALEGGHLDLDVTIPGKPLGAMRDIKMQLTKLKSILAKKTSRDK